jgi:hypothetical protein
MSNVFKINSAWLTVILSALGSTAYVLWVTSAKASEIDVAKREILVLQDSDRQQSAILNRLDERTMMILETLRRIEKDK